MAATAVGARLWRGWLAWRFRLWQQRRHRRLVLEQVCGHPILVLPDVFNPTLFFSSELLAAELPGLVASGSRVLDLGAGTGIQGIIAAAQGAHVVAVDILPQAVRCSRLNALLNTVEDRMDVRQGDLFAPVEGERFDLVLFNPPYYLGTPREPWEHAWRSADALNRFAAGLRPVLAPSGRAVLVVSSDVRDVAETADQHALDARVLRERRLPSERFLVLEWTPRAEGNTP